MIDTAPTQQIEEEVDGEAWSKEHAHALIGLTNVALCGVLCVGEFGAESEKPKCPICLALLPSGYK